MESGDPLPPEIYRLDAHRLSRAMGRARRRASLVLAATAAAATWIAASDETTLRAALDPALAVVAVAAGVAGYVLWTAGRRVRRSWNGFELGIGPRSLRVAGPGYPRVTVSRDQVVGILERAGGLTVRGSGASARVPRDVEAYGDIRARLATWSPIVRRWDPRAAVVAILLAAASAGCVYLALTNESPPIAVASVVFVTAVSLLAIVEVALHPSWQPTPKIVVSLVTGAALFALLAHIVHRAG
jgi:hypothetical protein